VKLVILLTGMLLASPFVMAQPGRVRILVIDPRGEPITRTAEASLLGNNNKPLRTVKANEAGEIIVTELPLGISRFWITALGFATKPITVRIRNGNEVKIRTRLEIGRFE